MIARDENSSRLVCLWEDIVMMKSTMVRCMAVIVLFTMISSQIHALESHRTLEIETTSRQTTPHHGYHEFPDCTHEPLVNSAICDQRRSKNERIDALIEQMSLYDKIVMLGSSGVRHHASIVPSVEWWNEALHGVAACPGVDFVNGMVHSATVFPAPINLGAALNRSLWSAVGRAISTEARAMSNVGLAGLNYWTPNVNVARDPRWGRTQEVAGEDPFVIAEYAVSMVRALQGDDDEGEPYTKVAATCKHFAAYDVENWGGVDRTAFDARVTEQDLYETYLPPFEACVREAHVEAVMCSYNAVNGVPSCANDFLIDKILRKQWAFDGHVVADCGAVDAIYWGHKYSVDGPTAVAAALKAGVDMDCTGNFYHTYLIEALNKSMIEERHIDAAFRRLIKTLLKLGWFDSADVQHYRQIKPDRVASQAHTTLALDAARQSIVLLKNSVSNQVAFLPLQNHVGMVVAAVGPHADATDIMLSNYHGPPPFITSPLNDLLSRNISTAYFRGCDTTLPASDAMLEQTVQGVVDSEAEVIFFFAGLDQSVEAEGNDRNDVELPGVQRTLIEKLLSLRIPLVLILFNAGGIDVSWARDHEWVKAIVWAGYPGEFGGQAVIETIFGLNNPSGRLPVTWYAAHAKNWDMHDMSMRPTAKIPGRTYRFYKERPVFSAFSGLSYSSFEYSVPTDLLVLTVSASSYSNGNRWQQENQHLAAIPHRVIVKNTGQVAGANTVMLFLKGDGQKYPRLRLIAFEKVYLMPAESRNVIFFITPNMLSHIDIQGRQHLEEGLFELAVGNVEDFIIRKLQVVFDGNDTSHNFLFGPLQTA